MGASSISTKIDTIPLKHLSPRLTDRSRSTTLWKERQTMIRSILLIVLVSGCATYPNRIRTVELVKVVSSDGNEKLILKEGKSPGFKTKDFSISYLVIDNNCSFQLTNLTQRNIYVRTDELAFVYANGTIVKMQRRIKFGDYPGPREVILPKGQPRDLSLSSTNVHFGFYRFSWLLDNFVPRGGRIGSLLAGILFVLEIDNTPQRYVFWFQVGNKENRDEE